MTYYPSLNWDVRYPPNWSDIRKATHEATGGICCCCKRNLSTEVHHSRYLWKNDTPSFNLFPLCDSCHKLSHSPKHWIKHKGNPLWKSRNTDEWETKLRQGFLELTAPRLQL